MEITRDRETPEERRASRRHALHAAELSAGASEAMSSSLATPVTYIV